MATKQNPVTETTTTAEPTALPFVFRQVVRIDTAEGKRVRRVRNVVVPAEGFDAAPMLAESTLATMLAECKADGCDMSTVFANLYPPVGYKHSGTVSKGFGVAADGSVQWVGREHKAGEPVPAAKAAKATEAKA